jgi:enoyl-CoA hydratase
MDTEPLVLVDRPLAGCAVVTLNRPRALNALSLALRRELVAAFDRLAADARVVVLTGAGRAFCAGLDLKELGALSDTRAAVVSEADNDPLLAIERFPGPVIGAINGPAVTGGFELALACDVLVASREASFADTHARVGLLPAWGLSQRLPRRIGAGRAKELSLTGNFLSADRADDWGLVNRVVEPEQLLPSALALAADMLSSVPEMLGAYKRLIDDGLGMTLADALRLEKQRSAEWSSRVGGDEIERRREANAQRARERPAGGG